LLDQNSKFPRDYTESGGVNLTTLSITDSDTDSADGSLPSRIDPGSFVHITDPNQPSEWVQDVLPVPRAVYQSFPHVRARRTGQPVVILPGFGNNTGDYEAPFGDPNTSLCASLRKRGFEPTTLEVERKDWFQVAKGLLSPGYWRGQAQVGPGYGWYLDRIDDAIERALTKANVDGNHDQVILVSHSAGGWLARAYLGRGTDPEKEHGGNRRHAVRALVTLGSPQRNTYEDSKGIDRTGGLITSIDTTFPGAYFSPEITYVCVGGRAVRGRRDEEKPRTLQRYAYNGYFEVVGEGLGVEGDSVVPCRCAFLPGARNVLLDGIFHSMSRPGTFDEGTDNFWYGSDEVLDAWLPWLGDSHVQVT